MLFQHANVSNAVNFLAKIKRGNYSHLLIRMTGTTAAAQDITVADVGNFFVMYRGKKIIQVSSGFLGDLGNQYGGFLEYTHGVASPFIIGLVIPFYLSGWPNSLYVVNDEECYVGVEFAATMLTALGANNVTTYISAAPSNIPMTYLLKILNADRSAVQGRSADPIPDKKVIRVYMHGTSDLVDVYASVDGMERYRARHADLLADTAWRKNVEVAIVTYSELNFADNPADFTNEKVFIEVNTTASITVYITYMAIDLAEKSIDEGRRMVAAQSAQKLENAQDLSMATLNRLKVASVEQAF